MIIYQCPRCGYAYRSPVRLAEVTHDCKVSHNHHQPLKEGRADDRSTS